MTALQKPSGRVRGIVAGDIVRRLVARTMAQQLSPAVELLLRHTSMQCPPGQALSVSPMHCRCSRSLTSGHRCFHQWGGSLRFDLKKGDVGSVV